MFVLVINDDFVSQDKIENFLKILKRATDNSTIQIKFSRNVIDIDLLLISYIIIFKEINPTINIEINLTENSSKESTDRDDITFKVKQYWVYCYLITGKSVFTILFNDRNSFPKFKNKQVLIDNQWFVISNSFVPFILVSKGQEYLYDIFFEKALFDENVKKEFEIPINWNPVNGDLYNLLSKYLRDFTEILPTRKVRFSLLKKLGKLAFYRSLYDAKILNIYLDPQYRLNQKRRPELYVSYLTSSGDDHKQYEYYDTVEPIFLELREKPLIYHFIFSILIRSDAIPNSIKVDTKVDFERKVHSLWEFTKDFVHGIKELAKNIIQHSQPPLGVVSGKIYSETIWEELKKNKKDSNNTFDKYIKKTKAKNPNETLTFFDLNVVDLGEKGVLETLLENNVGDLESNKVPDVLKKIYKKDIKRLEDNTISFHDFLNPTTSNRLQQQNKRATSHLGLLIFSKLVQKNDGLLRAGTKSIIKNERQESLTTNYFNNTKSNMIKYGTNYNVVLPISKKYERHLPDLKFPSESVEADVKGIEELLTYKILELKNYEIPKKIRSKTVITFNIKEGDNKEKLWNYFGKVLELIPHDKNLINLNLDKVSLNGSQLFRLLGEWELSYPKCNLAVSNIKWNVYKELIDINEGYLSKQNLILPYWNDKSIILFYSYTDTKHGRFYFTDALWGLKKSDFISLNQVIRKTSFNVITSLEKFENEPNLDLKGIIKTGLFYFSNTLLPFDLLIKGEHDLSIFENSASVLLQNNLNIE